MTDLNVFSIQFLYMIHKFQEENCHDNVKEHQLSASLDKYLLQH